MANEQSQNGRGVYQIDEITYAKGRGTLNAQRIEKSVIRSARTKLMAPNKCHGICFVHCTGQVP